MSSKANYGGKGREWHEDFIEYMYKICHHENYNGIPGGLQDNNVQDGKIRWNAPSNRPSTSIWGDLRQKRMEWWERKAEEYQIPRQGKWISKVAKAIHPFKEKPCQICGRFMRLEYVYPTKHTLTKLQRLVPGLELSQLETIDSTISSIYQHLGNKVLPTLREIFSIPQTVENNLNNIITYILEVIVPSEPKSLSPGSMSNAPDRLDGFHGYNLCCRKKEDIGRHDENMMVYTTDRRAFEWWSDGNWLAANRLMGKIRANNIPAKCPVDNCTNTEPMSADHIGPVSLGFCHIPKFQPMCRSCNSSKGNRFTFQDVQTLLQEEADGTYEIVSWHSKIIWDSMKNNIKEGDTSALALSKVMRRNLNEILQLFSQLYHAGHADFLLQFLNPEYALNDYEYIDFNPITFSYEKMVKIDRNKNYANAQLVRYVRIAFDSLEEYSGKENRNAEKNNDHGIKINMTVLNKIRASIIEALNQDVEKSNFPNQLIAALNQENADLVEQELAHLNLADKWERESFVVAKNLLDQYVQELHDQLIAYVK